MIKNVAVYFGLDGLKTTISTEIVAGISSFLALSYIIVVNPAVLSATGMPFAAVLTATVLVSFFSSVMMGVYAKNPIVVAPGMGLNAFFTYTAVLTMHIRWETALGAVFLSGIVFLLLSVFKIRTAIVKAIPLPLRYAISTGIGLFVALIGLANAKFVVAHQATMIGMGKMDAALATFLLGFFIMVILTLRQVRGAILIGILITTILAYPIGRWWGGSVPVVHWKGVFSAPDFQLIGKLDIIGAFKWSMVPVIFAFVFTDLFDSLSTLVGLCEAAGLVDEKGNPAHVNKALLTDAVSTTIAGVLGSSPGTAYVESAVGIAAGGRSGLTAIVAGLLFLPFLFLAPLLSIVPAIATAPALVLVGVFMMSSVTKIAWKNMEEAIPCFLAVTAIPFTYSITQGIVWGFLSWTIVKVGMGKAREISPTLYIIDAFAIMEMFFWGNG